MHDSTSQRRGSTQSDTSALVSSLTRDLSPSPSPSGSSLHSAKSVTLPDTPKTTLVSPTFHIYNQLVFLQQYNFIYVPLITVFELQSSEDLISDNNQKTLQKNAGFFSTYNHYHNACSEL